VRDPGRGGRLVRSRLFVLTLGWSRKESTCWRCRRTARRGARCTSARSGRWAGCQPFESLVEAQAFLDGWVVTVADVRVHGTTKRVVREHFAEELPHLGALPVDLVAATASGGAR